MNFDVSFRTLIIAPLEAASGLRLFSVNYWLLDFEEQFFHLDTPNESGIFAISLLFEGIAIDISPAWDRIHRDESNHHYIQAPRVPIDNRSGELAFAERLLKIPADRTMIWRDAINDQLIGAEVSGDNHTPQAIRLLFPSATVIISLGYSGDELYIGDGDELLVFSDEQWRLQVQRMMRPMNNIWACRIAKKSGIDSL